MNPHGLFVSFRYLSAIAVFTSLTGLAASSSAEEFPAVFVPQAAPDASSVSVSISAPLVGAATDDSSLSGSATLVVGQSDPPFDFAQLADVELILDDGMDFSLLGGAVTARAEPGATRVRMIETGVAGPVQDGQFDQLENIFQFEGEIFLSTEEGPYDLSTVAPMQADLLGIALENLGDRLVATATVDLEFTAAVAVPVLGQVPLTIKVQGILEAIAQLTRAGDLDGNGQLDANDIDLLYEGVRQQSTDPRLDLDGSGTVDEDDAAYLVLDLMNSYFGDANLDGTFDSSDLVAVLQVGEYEDDIELNSGWADGDWSGDAEFTSLDLVLALQESCYECGGPRQALAAVPEPATGSAAGIAAAMLLLAGRRR